MRAHSLLVGVTTKQHGYKYPHLNTPDPSPHIQDFSTQLAWKSFFPKIDLIRGYYQIPVAPDDTPKIAIIAPFGLFEFTRLPLGLRNAAQAFQRLMDETCRGLSFVFAYIDDLLVASSIDRNI